MAGPDWLTGGSFGVEASVVALVVCVAAGIALLRMAAKKGRIVPRGRSGRKLPDPETGIAVP